MMDEITVEKWVDKKKVDKAFSREFGDPSRLPPTKIANVEEISYAVPCSTSVGSSKRSTRKSEENYTTRGTQDFMVEAVPPLEASEPVKQLDPNSIDPHKNPLLAYQYTQSAPSSQIKAFNKPLILNLVTLFKNEGKELSGEMKTILEDFDVYVIKYALNAEPSGNERFTYVELSIDYPTEEFITRSLAPDTELVDRVKGQATADLGVTASCEFAPKVDLGAGLNTGANVKGTVDIGISLKWVFDLVQAKIIATGMQSSYSKWIIKEPEKMYGQMELSAVGLAKKDSTKLSFNVKGRYDVARGWWWWKHSTPVSFECKEPITLDLPKH